MVRVVPVLYVLAWVVMFMAAFMLVPLAVSLWLDDGASPAHQAAILLTGGAGVIMWLTTRRQKQELQTRDGFLLVALVWTMLPVFAMLPLLFQMTQISVTDAYFEAVSGLTTTGATVISGLDRLPASVNIWRGLLSWLGGMGIIVLAVAILPLLGVGGSQVFKAETPGPMKDSKLTPRITQAAKSLWMIYTAFTIACVLAYRLAGLEWMDALMHGFTTMAIGGFSSYDASFAQFDSVVVECVAIAFMTLAGINFTTHVRALLRRSAAPYRRDPELLWYVGVVAASVLVIAAFLYAKGVYADPGTALRHAAFNVVSVATTTGYATTDYSQWPIFAPMWMLFLCTFATCSGSTGGGIKMIRARLMFQQALRELTRIVHPRAQIPVKIGGQVVENNIVFAVLAFMLMYGGIMVASSLLLMASGMDLTSAYSAVVACLNNLGPGLGQVGPATTYASLSDLQTWVCTILMLLGRLELFTLLVVFTPSFWQR